jgi:RNA methyltransferase, TrmH family
MSDTISSLENPKIRYIRSLQSRRRVRQKEEHFVFEGVRLVEEIVKANVAPRFVVHSTPDALNERERCLVTSFREQNISCYEISEQVMSACSDTKTPQGILAVIPIPHLPDPSNPAIILLVDQVRDPGNLGTILRTAWAANVELVLLAPGTVDPTNPKVVRSAMGAHLHIPIAVRNWDAIVDTVTDTSVWLSAADGSVPYTSVDWTEPTTVIVGGEAAGAGVQATSLATGRISIPLAPGVESLNAAVAAAVILFEAVRQRESPRAACNPTLDKDNDLQDNTSRKLIQTVTEKSTRGETNRETRS